MSDRNVYLDLFAGLGGFSAAFEDSDTWEVITVEIEERFEPDSRYPRCRRARLLYTWADTRTFADLLVPRKFIRTTAVVPR